MTSSEFLKKHTVPFEIEGQGQAGIKMRTTNDKPVCLLMDEELAKQQAPNSKFIDD